MKFFTISEKLPTVSRIGLGCMRITNMGSADKVREWIAGAIEEGINFFDHADIYGGGECESIFGRALTPSLREKIVLQSKCAIRPGICYDFGRDYIINSVDGILKRLNQDHIDILLLHRPDALCEPEEVAEAFEMLSSSGKVLAFGVSNHNPMQIELLNRYCEGKVKINQMQYSIAHCLPIDEGLNVNIANDAGCMRTGSLIDYSRLKGIVLQAWSPFQYGMFNGTFIGSEKYPELNKTLDRLAEKYSVSPNAIAIAWILRHPAQIQAIIGSTNLDRVRDTCKGADVVLTREEWYGLYLSAGKMLP